MTEANLETKLEGNERLSFKEIWWGDTKRKIMTVFMAASIIGATGFVANRVQAVNENDKRWEAYQLQLQQKLDEGIVPIGDINYKIRTNNCYDGAIKQYVEIKNKTYCIFPTGNRDKPFTSEPYSPKCECECKEAK